MQDVGWSVCLQFLSPLFSLSITETLGTGLQTHMRQLKEKRLLDRLFNPPTRLMVQCNPLIKYFKRYGRGKCPDQHLLNFNNIALKLAHMGYKPRSA